VELEKEKKSEGPNLGRIGIGYVEKIRKEFRKPKTHKNKERSYLNLQELGSPLLVSFLDLETK